MTNFSKETDDETTHDVGCFVSVRQRHVIAGGRRGSEAGAGKSGGDQGSTTTGLSLATGEKSAAGTTQSLVLGDLFLFFDPLAANRLRVSGRPAVRQQLEEILRAKRQLSWMVLCGVRQLP